MNSSPRQTVQTAVPGLALVELTPADIQAYYATSSIGIATTCRGMGTIST